jgi:hypothetical protein
MMRKRILCTALVIAVCLSVLCGCRQGQGDTSQVYENKELGFSIEFPSTWKGKYAVEANPQSASGVVVEAEWGGTLCYIFRETAEEWADSMEEDSIIGEYRVLGENSDSVYVLYFPTDVNYDPEDEEQVETYNEMHDDLYNLNIKFEILEQ